MWYFTWILGLGFALLCGLVNLLWLEARWAAGPLTRISRSLESAIAFLDMEKADTQCRPFVCTRV
ncbi:hypothetical protein OEJJJPPD_01112 [Aeromonas salmonicida]